MLSVVLRVPNGPPPKSRAAVRGARSRPRRWGTDILRETSYLWLARLAALHSDGRRGRPELRRSSSWPSPCPDRARQPAAPSIMLARGVDRQPARDRACVAPSDRIGRKPVIYVCTARGSLGVGIVGAGPERSRSRSSGRRSSARRQGMFLAVDWALMTDIIPRAASGRYMGLSNVVTAPSTTIALIYRRAVDRRRQRARARGGQRARVPRSASPDFILGGAPPPAGGEPTVGGAPVGGADRRFDSPARSPSRSAARRSPG